jgi:hypothetical protein
MPTGLRALRDDEVEARVRRALGLGARADLAQHQRAGVVRGRDERPRVGKRMRDHAHTFIERDARAFGGFRIVRDEVGTERAIRAFECPSDLVAQGVGRADHPETAAGEDGGRQCGTGDQTHGRVEDRVLDVEEFVGACAPNRR